MIRKVVILAIIAFFIIAIYTKKEGDFIDTGIKRVVSVFQSAGEYVKENFIDNLIDKGNNLFQEKKESVDEEIRSETEKIQEDMLQKGRSVWDKIGDFIFRRGESN